MVEATLKESSNSVGYIGFSFLLHSSLAALLLLAPSLRPLPPGTVEMTEIAVISEAAPLGNTAEPVVTELPPAPAPTPAAAEIVKKEMAASDSVVVAPKKPTPAAASAKAKAPPAPPVELPAKESAPEPAPAPESEETPVVAAVPVEMPEETVNTPPAQSAEESAAYQEYQKAESAIDEDQALAAEPKLDSKEETSTSDKDASEEQVTEAAVVAAAGKENRPEALEPTPPPPQKNPAVAQSTPGQGSGSGSEPAGGVNGIPEGARLNTDLRQHPGNVPPVYPAVARQSGWEGTVSLSYNVSSEGRVENIRITKSSGYQILDREAYRAISRYRYLPGQQGQTYHPVIFRLTGPAQALPSRLRTSGASRR
ncbi:MAG: energy transducer TonB [Bdellovibrionales bacterium]|nr:energy transducer TonB [Bdellovibrionales bacterium]